MGKSLTQQKRGKGSPTYRARSFSYIGKVSYPAVSNFKGRVVDILHSAGHSGPIAKIAFGKKKVLLIAPHGMRVGDEISAGENSEVKRGNILQLKSLPTGTNIYNIESQPGDGGKFVRASGTSAKIISKMKDKITVMLPSKKTRVFNQKCRATVGIIAGSGRTEKPFYKAGRKYHKMRAKNRLYPRTSALAMNAVAHPYGGSRTSKKGKPMIARRNAPPGAKVGLLRPKRSGKKR